jgi:hypothetical protein
LSRQDSIAAEGFQERNWFLCGLSLLNHFLYCSENSRHCATFIREYRKKEKKMKEKDFKQGENLRCICIEINSYLVNYCIVHFEFVFDR